MTAGTDPKVTDTIEPTDDETTTPPPPGSGGGGAVPNGGPYNTHGEPVPGK